MPLALGKVPLVPLFWFFLFERSRIHLNHIFFNLDGLGPTSKMPTLIYWSIMMQQSTKIKSKIIRWSIWNWPKWKLDQCGSRNYHAISKLCHVIWIHSIGSIILRISHLFIWSEVIHAHFTALWSIQKLMIWTKMTRYHMQKLHDHQFCRTNFDDKS